MTHAVDKPLGIGSTVWRFDSNRRVYPKEGGIGVRPIWREHWYPVKITGETKTHWICDTGYEPFNIPKRGPSPNGVLTSERVLDEACWVEAHRHAIARLVDGLRDHDYARLSAAAKALGYEPSEAKIK